MMVLSPAAWLLHEHLRPSCNEVKQPQQVKQKAVKSPPGLCPIYICAVESCADHSRARGSDRARPAAPGTPSAGCPPGPQG
eukprot:scaffold204699_cov31-Prasinocladus_malaysianus.AAC.1